MDKTDITQEVQIGDIHNRNQDYEGYVVILNTLAKFFSDTRDDEEKYCNKIAEEARKGDTEEYSRYFQTFLTFGEFDRIFFKGVNRFARFFDLDQRSKYWLGKHQNVFLYRIDTDESGTRLYPYYEDEKQHSGKKDFGFCYRNQGLFFCYSAITGTITQSNCHALIGTRQFLPFFLLTQISFSNEVITRVSDYASFLKDIKKILREKLERRIKESHYRVLFDIYGCMNTSEIAILWLCSQYTEVLELMDYLKSMDFKAAGMCSPKNVFFSFYSVIGRTLEHSSKAEKLFPAQIRECRGTAGINLAVSDSNSASEVFALCRNSEHQFENMRIIPGEHDIAMEVPSWQAYDLLCEEDIGSPDNGFFKEKENRQKILGIKVSLYGDKWDETKIEIARRVVDLGKSVQDLPDRVKQFAELEKELTKRTDENKRKELYKKNQLNPEDLTLRELYQLIRDELKSRYNSHTGSVDTLDMLYTDYLSNIHETFNAVWRNDYHYQFKKSLIYLLEKVIEKTERENEQFWDVFTETVENLRQQTEHFSQSGRLVMQIPASHLRYTASVDMLFHSYYGAAKAILDSAYRNQTSNQYQSELLPIITTNITPMITSKLYKAGVECDDLRILQIDIPYSLLFDPVTGFPFLIHELFHYITPSSRWKRNEAIIEMAVNEVLTYSWYTQVEKGLGTYLFGWILKNVEKARGMGFERVQEYDSPQGEAFYDDYHKIFASERLSRQAIPSRMSVLKSSIAHVMWDNPGIQSIRQELVKQTTNPESDGQHKSIQPERQTWKDITDKQFWRTVNRLSINMKSIVSEQLASEMREAERLIEQLNKGRNIAIQQLNKRFTENMVIHTETPFYRLKRKGDQTLYELNEFDAILYKHKYNLLNPNLLSAIKNDNIVTHDLIDIFMNGLREAIPDYAMVKYCDMDDIEYLVTYARFTHDTYNSAISSYDVLRLCFVLIWLSDKQLYSSGEINVFDKFEFEDKAEDFIEQYVTEYMPHLKDKGKDGEVARNYTEKILDLLSEAVWWFLEILKIADKFKRDYDMYYSCILQLRESYSIYFDNPDGRSEQLKHLVEIVKDHRKIKRTIRKQLIPDSQWKLIHQIARYCYKCSYPDIKEVPAKQWEVKDIRNLMKLNRVHHVVNEAEYIARMDQYDRKSFKKILEFVQICEKQKTFDALARDKAEYIRSKKEHAEDDGQG